MGKESNYYKDKEQRLKITLQEQYAELPPFVKAYLEEKPKTSMVVSSKVAYASDLLCFFRFLIQSNPLYKEKSPRDFSYQELEQVTPEDIDEYKSYLSLTNSDAAMARKFAPLKGLYQFCNRRKYVNNNPLTAVILPSAKSRDKHRIIRMDKEQVNDLRAAVMSSGEGSFSEWQSKLCSRTKQRDYAIIMLFLSTGMRVSELVGLDLSDIDFKRSVVSIVRKGGGSDQVGFVPETTGKALMDYIEGERSSILPKVLNEKDRDALFISGKYRRISVDSVQLLVKKYAQIAAPGVGISCHKLRSTYGSTLYNATGDINLVSKVLGHASPSTTAKYYSDLDNSRKLEAGKIDVYQ
ncbi:MAG: tyrosine-type recombinase/integrase [Acetivibrio ethanolgignens]